MLALKSADRASGPQEDESSGSGQDNACTPEEQSIELCHASPAYLVRGSAQPLKVGRREEI